MLWYPDANKIIITPPHTASGNLSKALPKQHGCILVCGPGPDGNVDHHYAQMSSSFDVTTQVACVYRDPEPRLLGLWSHYNWYAETTHEWKPQAWTTFVRWVAANSDKLSWFYKWTIRGLLAYAETSVHAWIRFDHLSEDIEAFTGLPFVMPSRNTEQKRVGDYWTANERQLLRTWIDRDRTMFGESP